MVSAAEATDLFRAPPDRWIDVGSAEVALRTVGAGPAVLFVHGWPVSGATFRTLLPHLADHATCHIVDLPGTGSSRFDAGSELSVDGHIRAVRTVLDQLDAADVAVVGHDSGGLIARHAALDHPKVRALGLIDTEQPQGLTWRFRLFLTARHLPGFGAALAWSSGRPRLRRNPLVLGGAFADPTLLEGAFDEFFLLPLRSDPAKLDAAVRLLRSFTTDHVEQLADIHRRTTVPVQLVWGTEDIFFPVELAREMVATFPDAALTEVAGAGLFSHEERPEAVAAALTETVLGQEG